MIADFKLPIVPQDRHQHFKEPLSNLQF
jgi:hypothetical protein